MNIVVVLRSATNRRIVSNALQLIGQTNMTCYDNHSVLIEQLAEQPPDLLILGKELPEITGSQLAAQICRSSKLPHPPMLVVGYEFTEKEVLNGARQGVDDFLLMPFAPETLQEKISLLTAPPEVS